MTERLSDYDFALPEELIALRPARPRPSSRLLVAGPEGISDRVFSALPELLRAGDMLVFNDTRVIPGRLRGLRTRETRHGSGEAAIEVTLLAPGQPGEWQVLAKPAKRLAPGDVIRFGEGLSAEVLAKGEAGEVSLRFNVDGDALDAALDRVGEMPLPPYIAARRAADVEDREDYQTVFARVRGAVAAPTASLHFDEALLDELEAGGVLNARVTLHVGAGTFLPVKSDDISQHRMHSEWGAVSAEAAAAILAAKTAGGRIIPVGTTALRLIETAAAAPGGFGAWSGDTDIFIRPGFHFAITDGLITNFHLPKSTLMMLVSALMGRERIRDIYAHAIAENYRFFSYGDSSLLLPRG
ncbi:tRNA preQ1(34) S-adenosylmethionine ribosyltransferase-isomerase QueA [Algicella marina]|uniref:S-adenosylmethionine:tRNA ribosyltransferase-isomerase n=1 Tax=Algicella marina TaxID=2683284 RepID=A0A6P1SW29_9RHOB|nr:tRNA preQ1(34) S-adenosylmethionine ribosyltransferase-isomerase QueA [Algicella marina]QHQ34658.1 tRNA preQ1(34) S-adenosylmethionine ribosyltransferase-isomerase QueA [Algicella marina]